MCSQQHSGNQWQKVRKLFLDFYNVIQWVGGYERFLKKKQALQRCHRRASCSLLYFPFFSLPPSLSFSRIASNTREKDKVFIAFLSFLFGKKNWRKESFGNLFFVSLLLAGREREKVLHTSPEAGVQVKRTGVRSPALLLNTVTRVHFLYHNCVCFV